MSKFIKNVTKNAFIGATLGLVDADECAAWDADEVEAVLEDVKSMSDDGDVFEVGEFVSTESLV